MTMKSLSSNFKRKNDSGFDVVETTPEIEFVSNLMYIADKKHMNL